MDHDDRDDMDIERRLQAYADARLTPDPASMGRVRAAVLDAAVAPMAGPAIVSLPALPAPPVADRTSLRSLGRGRLRGRSPAPVFRWDDPLEAMQETAPDALPEALAVASPEALADALPGALAVASPEALAAASPEALALASPEALAAASPEALADALPEALAVASPEALADALPEALAVASPEALADALPEALAVASPEALADALPDALAVAWPEALAVASSDALADAVPPQIRAESTGRVRRAELIPVVDPPAPVQTGRWVRRGVAALLAAGLLLGGAVAVSAAPPDSPLYDTRLLLENLTLPAAASERAEARVAALHERIKEAKGAANGKNGKAVAAALKAYRASVKDALKEAGDDPAALASLYAALGLHLEALQTLDAENVADAQGAVKNALEDSQNAVTEIEKRGHGKPEGTPGRGPKG